MSQLYFVLTRRCNQFCTSCPRHQEERIADEKYENVKGRLLNTLKKFDVDSLILSGGEPTLYSEFPKLLNDLVPYSGSVLIQSNAQKFRNMDFVTECFGNMYGNKYHVMTAVHSMVPEIHERITGVPGSFENVIQAIHNLLELNVQVTVKCILSKLNYKQLPQYVSWLSEEFNCSVALCISGMDYIGMSFQERAEYMLDYKDAVSYIEDMVHYYETEKSQLKTLVLIELPLCMLDEKYWKYFRNTRTGKQLYQDAYMGHPARRFHDFTTNYEECQACRVKGSCPGIWNEQYKTYKGRCIMPITGRCTE